MPEKTSTFVTEVPLETNPFNRKITLKLLLIIVRKLFEILWWISALLEWVPETKQIFTPMWNEKCCCFCQLAMVIADRESCTCFWKRLLWNTHFSKQKNLLLFTISRNVCMLWDHSLRERSASRDEYGKLLILGSSSLKLLKEKNLQFIVLEVGV